LPSLKKGRGMRRNILNRDAGLTRRAFSLGAPAVCAVAGVSGGAETATGFAVLLAEWQSLRRKLDSALTLEDEQEAIETALYDLTASLMAMPGANIWTVVAKLSILLSLAPIECGQTEEFPWPQIRTVIKDLGRLEIMLPL
jgi:hypothetical protein